MWARALKRRRLLGGAAGVTVASLLPPGARAAVETRAFNDRFWGWPFPADSTRGARWMRGRRLSIRLRADRSGTVTGLVWNMHVAQGSDREGRYSARDGGFVHVELRASRTDDYPLRGWPDLGPRGLLAHTAPNNGRDEPLEDLDPDGGASWQHWPFTRPAEVRAGQVYHAVFVPHETRAWSAINCFGQDAPAPLGSGQFGGPYYGDDFTVLRETDAVSEVFENLADPDGPTVGILLLRYADGMLIGPPAGGTWRSARKPIGGRYVVRQAFTMADRSRTADSVWVRVWTDGEPPADLVVELAEGEDGSTLLESIPVPPARVPEGPPTAGGSPVPMLHFPFRRLQRLEAGRAYQLRLYSVRRGYETVAVRQLNGGEELDLGAIRDRIGPEIGVAELSTDGGTSWEGWTVESVSGGPRRDMALPVAFSVGG